MAFTRSTVGPSVLGGTYRIVMAKVTPDAATGNIVFSEFGTVDAVIGCQFAGDLTANCYTVQAAIDGSVVNQVNFKLWKAGGTAADTAFVAFWVTVVTH